MASILTVSTARAGMVQLAPLVSIKYVSVTYAVSTTDASVGHLHVSGTTKKYTLIDGGLQTPLMKEGSLTLDAYFDLATGGLLSNEPGMTNTLNVTGSATSATTEETLFYSEHLLGFDFTLNATSSSTLDFLFKKDAGVFSAMKPYPWIGLEVMHGGGFTQYAGAEAFTSTGNLVNQMKAYTGTYALGTTLFQSNGTNMNRANAFLTPTPTAMAGGVASFAFAAIRRNRQRRERGAATESNR